MKNSLQEIWSLFNIAMENIATIAHLKKGSVKVKAGDTVTTGQLIGSCGNSGNSSEPHIHFEVPSGTDENKLTTLPITFKDGMEPIRGDIVSGTINKQL